jgi:hypothetical protein
LFKIKRRFHKYFIAMDSNEKQVIYQNSKFGLEKLQLLACPIYCFHPKNSQFNLCFEALDAI